MISETLTKLRNGELTPEEYVYSTYEKIRRVEPKIRSLITLLEPEKLATQVKESLKKRGKLSGVLLAIKDNISTKGIRTTCASKILEDYVPPYNATVVERLLEEGAVILGKTNMDEFAMGSTTETSYFGPTRNPWDLERTPGGSSGGSGAIIASGIVDLALGSDTGGSIRAPAAFTATFGLKPSYGTVSRYGLVAYANSLEQIGPMASSAEDLAILFSVIAGNDPRDATTIDYRPQEVINKISPKGMKFGIIKEILEASDKPIKTEFTNAINKISSEGGEIEEVSLKYAEYALPAYYIIAMSEASSNLARFDGVRYGYSKYFDGLWRETFAKNRGGFGIEVKRRILLGAFALSAGYYDQFYLKALKVRRLIKEGIDDLFRRVNILLSPTMPILPPKLKEVIDDPIKMYSMDLNTVLANLAGIPALSMPIGFYNNLPIGLQLMGPYLSDESLIGISMYLEKIFGLYNLKAPV